MIWHFIQTVAIPLLPCILGLLFNACCCGGCIFVGPLAFASGAVTDNFSVVSGSWSIGSGVLSTSSSSAVLTGLVANPNGDANTKITCTVNIATNGDTARIILEYIDASNFWFVEVLAGTGAYIRIYQRSGGVNTLKAGRSASLSNGSDMLICVSIVNGSFIVVNVNTAPAIELAFSGGTFTGATWGIGTGTGSGSRTFDNLSVGITSTDCLACGSCSICSGSNPNTFKIVIPVTANVALGCSSCASFAGTWYAGYIGNCTYRYFWGSTICGSTNVTLTLNDFSGHKIIEVTITTSVISSASMDWQHDFGVVGSINCMTVLNQSCALISGDGVNCDATGTTCTVTSM